MSKDLRKELQSVVHLAIGTVRGPFGLPFRAVPVDQLTELLERTNDESEALRAALLRLCDEADRRRSASGEVDDESRGNGDLVTAQVRALIAPPE